MEYSLSMQDIILLIKKNVKFVLVFALICGLLLSGYRIVKDKKNQAGVDMEQATKSVQKYNDWTVSSNIANDEMNDNLVRTYKVMEKHPLMKLNSDDCNIRNITFLFEEDSEASKENIVKSWLNGLDCETLFGTDNDLVKQFRGDILNIWGENGEVVVEVYDIKEYDFDKVAKKIVSVVKSNSKAKGIELVDVQNNKISGFSQQLFDKQDIIRSNIVRLANECNALNNYKMDPPGVSVAGNGFDIKGLLTYGIVGFIVGFALAVLLLLFRTIKKGTIMSCKQIDEFFSIEKLGKASSSEEEDIKLINAVVKALNSDINEVMLVSNSRDKEYDRMTSALDRNDNISYKYGTVENESIECIEEMKDVDGIIMPVTIGKTTNEEVRNVIKWSGKFRKNVLGYIVVG